MSPGQLSRELFDEHQINRSWRLPPVEAGGWRYKRGPTTTQVNPQSLWGQADPKDLDPLEDTGQVPKPLIFRILFSKM